MRNNNTEVVIYIVNVIRKEQNTTDNPHLNSYSPTKLSQNSCRVGYIIHRRYLTLSKLKRTRSLSLSVSVCPGWKKMASKKPTPIVTSYGTYLFMWHTYGIPCGLHPTTHMGVTWTNHMGSNRSTHVDTIIPHVTPIQSTDWSAGAGVQCPLWRGWVPEFYAVPTHHRSSRSHVLLRSRNRKTDFHRHAWRGLWCAWPETASRCRHHYGGVACPNFSLFEWRLDGVDRTRWSWAAVKNDLHTYRRSNVLTLNSV